MNIAELIAGQACRSPNATAVIMPGGTLTFAELQFQVVAAAQELRWQGVEPGMVLALDCTNECGILISMLGAARIGATVISLPRKTPAVLWNEVVHNANVRFHIGDCAAGNTAGLPHITIGLDTPGQPLATANFMVPLPDAPFLIIVGSGSTGYPKLMAVTHAQFLARIDMVREMLALMPDDRLTCLSHLDFTSPKERCLAALAGGSTVVFTDRLRHDPVTLCRDRNITVLDATVFHLEQMLARLPDDARIILPDLRLLQVSASSVSEGLRRRITTKITPKLHIRYGTNETGPLSMAPPNLLNTPGTVGRPPVGVTIEIVDKDGSPLSAGQVGHVRVRSPGAIDGYLDDAESTHSSFRDNWFYPGDLGSLTYDGQFVFYGRTDHMMIMNGINIYPAEIERSLSQHVAVLDLAAVPLPSRIHQDVPVCAVTLQAGADVSERELLDFANKHLGSHSPSKVIILERIPRNPQGKLMRTELIANINDSLRPKRNAVRMQLSPFKLRQPARQMQFRCQIDHHGDLASLDDWLNLGLEIGIERCKSAVKPVDEHHGFMIELTWRVMLLFRNLMQASNIPIFDTGCVLKIDSERQDPSSWIATIAVANVEHIPPRCYSIAIDEAVRLVQWMMSKQYSPENAEALFQSVMKQAIHPIRRMVIAGKSTFPVLCAANSSDIPFTHLGAGVYQLGWGSKSRRMDRSTTELDSAIGSKLTQNKIWSANLIRKAGLPAPKHAVVITIDEAVRMARLLRWPVVVKPVDRDRGEGVTVGVKDDIELKSAFRTAQRLSKARQVIIEREVRGVCHRLFIANGQLLYAVKRLPKSIHGDGQKTLAELISAANEKERLRPPWLRSEHYPDDEPACQAMALAGFTPQSIPAVGERVPLRNIESTAQGGFDEDVTACIHPDNIDIALRATALFHLNVAGIDIITPDLGQPWHANGAIINEVNFAPLLGGGEISRSHIPKFLAQFMNGDGRIPIEVVFGNDGALDVARARQNELVSQQIHCFLTSHELTLTAAGETVPFPFKGLYQRCKALLMDQRVGAIVLVVQTDELLRSGLPVDRIDRITQIGDGTRAGLPPAKQTALMQMLQAALHVHAISPSESLPE